MSLSLTNLEIIMLIVGDAFPDFNLTAVTGSDHTKDFHSVSLFFFWPKDFTFVCPTEIVGFGNLHKEFKACDAELIGASTDSDFVHAAWRTHHAQLKACTFPWLADIKKELSSALGILHAGAGIANRATFIVDPDNVIRYVEMTELSVGRNPKETLRVLQALQKGELMPCDWQPGQATLS
jgi:alkyl hydroperoxide reductase subunit AhpC